MKIMTVNINRIRIEFNNNLWTGHQTIIVDGQLVSKKFSIFGREHIFDVFEEGDYVEYTLKTGLGPGYGGIIYDLYRNGKLLVSSDSIKSIFFSKKGNFSFNGHSENIYREEDFV